MDKEAMPPEQMVTVESATIGAEGALATLALTTVLVAEVHPDVLSAST
jgi:hypothetical protein